MEEEKDYIKKQRANERRASKRFKKKCQRLGKSPDYQRKIEHRNETGQPRISLEDAITILTKIWLNLIMALKNNKRRLSHAAFVLRCFIETDHSIVPNRSIKVFFHKSYALRRGVSEEQARLDFYDGLAAISRAVRRVLYESRETAVADFCDSLLVIKRLGQIDSEYPIDDDIKIIDHLITILNTLKIKRRIKNV